MLCSCCCRQGQREGGRDRRRARWWAGRAASPPPAHRTRSRTSLPPSAGSLLPLEERDYANSPFSTTSEPLDSDHSLYSPRSQPLKRRTNTKGTIHLLSIPPSPFHFLQLTFPLFNFFFIFHHFYITIVYSSLTIFFNYCLHFSFFYIELLFFFVWLEY